MASDFIGVQMLVTLRDPPTRLKGTVSEVEAGTGLTLTNGMWSTLSASQDLEFWNCC
jgi:hypothetical protein